MTITNRELQPKLTFRNNLIVLLKTYIIMAGEKYKTIKLYFIFFK